MSYTKGKWEIEIIENKTCVLQSEKDAELWQGAPDPRFIATVGCGSSSIDYSDEDLANTQRICQCVNGWDELERQRDELLEACKWAAKSEHHPTCKFYKGGVQCDCHVFICQNAIAKAEKPRK
jgi:hypothetical protein